MSTAAASLGSATQRLDEIVDSLSRAERELGEVSDRLADLAHDLVRRAEELHSSVARAWTALDGAA